MALILPRFDAVAQRIEDARKVAQIVAESGELPVNVRAGGTVGGDRSRMRGVPICGLI